MSTSSSASAPETAALADRLRAIDGITLKTNEPLAAHTSMAVGGPARLFIEVDRSDALTSALAELDGAGVVGLFLGGGSNTLFSDEGFAGAIIRLGREFRTIELVPEDPRILRAGAAATVGAIMKFSKRQSLTGLEFCVGIPGMLGGALAGNAGAGGEEICPLAEWVEVLDEKLRTKRLARGEFEFRYRWSELRRFVILGAGLRLEGGERAEIERRIEAHLAKRREQPGKERSAGCMFKNPPGDAAGRLVDQAGLKGLCVGGISVSDAHANFMVNDGGGTTADVVALMEEVRAKVKVKFGVELETEVRVTPPGGPPAD